MGAVEPSHHPKVVSMDVCGQDDSEYRVLMGDQVKYVVIAPNTFDRSTLSMPLDSLSSLPWDEEWTIASVSRDPGSGKLKTSLSQRKLAGVRGTWNTSLIDVLTLKRVEQLTGASSECIWTPLSPGAPRNVIAKIARFEWEIPRIEQETGIYRILEGSGLAPQFLGHIHEHGRVIGLLLEKVPGREGRIEDLEKCSHALQQLHKLGVLHGDINRYNFIVDKDRVVMIDFERSRTDGDEVATRAEMESLWPTGRRYGAWRRV